MVGIEEPRYRERRMAARCGAAARIQYVIFELIRYGPRLSLSPWSPSDRSRVPLICSRSQISAVEACTTICALFGDENREIRILKQYNTLTALV